MLLLSRKGEQRGPNANSPPRSTREGLLLIRPIAMPPGCFTAQSLPLWGRWPSAARSDEVAAAGTQAMVLPQHKQSPAMNSRGTAAYSSDSHAAWMLHGAKPSPLGKVAERQRGRMRSRRWRDAVAPMPVHGICRFHCGCGHPLENSRFFFSFFDACCVAPGLPPRPAQGRGPCTSQGVSPLDPFPLARSLGVERY